MKQYEIWGINPHVLVDSANPLEYLAAVFPTLESASKHLDALAEGYRGTGFNYYEVREKVVTMTPLDLLRYS
jgi:hypothetical protein